MGGDKGAKQGWQAAVWLLGSTPGLALMACAGDSSPGDDAGTLSQAKARVEVVASDIDVAGTVAPLVQSFIADGSGVYWYDSDGAVWAQRRGEPGPVELKPALERPRGESLVEFVKRQGSFNRLPRAPIANGFILQGAMWS